MDSQTYTMRKHAVEGRVFYENRLTDPEWVRTYFPPTEMETNYARRPKISVPITGEVIDRLASLVYGGMSIEFENQKDEALWEEIAERNNFRDRSRLMLVNPLARGTEVTVLHAIAGGVFWQNWGGEFAYFMASPFYEAAGYEYIENDEGIKPVVSPFKKAPKGYTALVIDGTFYVSTQGETVKATQHNLPFAPFVFCRAVDVDAQGRYAWPYHTRARDLLIEYNHIFSQSSKAIKILQNVWKTNKTIDNPNQPLRLDPDTINFVGETGTLEQVQRALTLEPEFGYLSRLKQHISSRFQVPDFMTGLSDVGKVESGIALGIVSGPLIELVERIRPSFRQKVRELVYKSLMIEQMSRGRAAREPEFTVNLNDTVLPMDVKNEIETLIRAKESGLISEVYMESLAAKVAALLDLQETQQ